MPDSEEQSPNDDYFNDLTQQPQQYQDDERRGSQEDANGQVPKPKRIACVLCRKRKLRCDGNKPSCGTCNRLQHDCSYDEMRRKSGPKRGYVKALEARLAQVETMLKTQDEPLSRSTSGARDAPAATTTSGAQAKSMVPDFSNIAVGNANVDMLPHIENTIGQHDYPPQSQYPHATLGAVGNGNGNIPTEEAFPWEMIGLGLDEPLPVQEVVDDLNRTYFEKIHPSLPMIHRPRYYAAMNLAPHMRPPVCLRYAMWCNAASVTDKYEGLQEHFYLRARKYVQQDELKGHGESMITTAHCQTWALLATYEFKLMYFPRAWMSSGRGSRMSQMMGLHRLDGQGLDVKQCLPPPKDWTEREERRRTFWMCFCVDRYSSIGTGWPMVIEELDINTNLPSDDQDYELGKQGKVVKLNDVLEPQGVSELTSYAGVVLLACLFGRNLTHLHRPGPDDRDNDLDGEFWKRHRALDNIMLNISLGLPDNLRLSNGMSGAIMDSNLVFMNMSIHTSTICLHQAAIFMAEKNRMPQRMLSESKVRCITAASEIASMMRQISHLDLSSMNPFISFCLYVAARVFVQYLKSRPRDVQVRASLQFLLSAMHAIKRKNPLTESFLVQLDVDLESSGLEDTRTLRAAVPRSTGPRRYEGCAFHLDKTDITGISHDAPTYGDSGLAMYNQPNAPGASSHSSSSHDGTDQFTQHTADLSNLIGGSPAFELPNRQRTPGSFQSSNSASYRSPQTGNIDMDISPDTSGGDQQTPNSSTQSHPNMSSNTSNTAYSPQNMPQSQSQYNPKQGSFDHNNMMPTTTSFTPTSTTMFGGVDGFDINSFTMPTPGDQQQQSGFITTSEDWGGGGTGFTPGPSGTSHTGMTPGGNISDMMGMSEDDWNQVLGSMGGGDGAGGWDTGVEHDQTMHEAMREIWKAS